MRFDRLQLLQDIIAQVDQSVVLDPDTIQESHPGRVSPEQLAQLQIFAADVQQLRDAIAAASDDSRAFPSAVRHLQHYIAANVGGPIARREISALVDAMTTVQPFLADALPSHYELTATGRAALDSHQGA